MRIVVCIKEVPATTKVNINPETNTLIREGVESIINPFDTYALEEGVRIKERLGEGCVVTALSMGPPQVERALKEAISLGADEGILLSDRAFAGADTLATSYTLARAIEKIGGFGLVICGKQAIDGDTAQVGPEMSEKLDVPFVAYVRKIEAISDKRAVVERMTDDGYDVIELPLPAVITVVKEINEPRIASLKGKMRAKKAQITLWTSNDIDAQEEKIGLNGSATKVIKIFAPKQRGKGIEITGEPQQIVDTLYGHLKKDHTI
jgi:electron transfer flavoprotein beta subunit